MGITSSKKKSFPLYDYDYLYYNTPSDVNIVDEAEDYSRLPEFQLKDYLVSKKEQLASMKKDVKTKKQDFKVFYS